MPSYRAQGIVVRTTKLGETDRIVTLVTKERGKVRAVAKGVRKPGNKIGGRLEVTSHVLIQAYEGRNLDVINQVETIDSFRGIREHYGALTHAVSILEICDQIAQDGEPNEALYAMLLGALVEMNERPNPLVAPAFFWKLLALEGFSPELDRCVNCGGAEPFLSFDIADGGVRCNNCAVSAGIRIHPATLTTLRWIVGGELRKALSGVGADDLDGGDPREVIAEIERIALASVEYHFERRLKSAALL